MTDSPGYDASVAYDRTGKRIAFCSSRTGSAEIWTMRADGSNQHQVTAMGGQATFPDFAPSGRRLAFAFRGTASPSTDIWTIRARGGQPRQLTKTADRHEAFPVYSPNGRHIVYLSGDGQANQVWIMDRHGRHQRQLTFDATLKDQVPDWRPDGKKIAYQADGDIWLMNPDGTGQVNITRTPDIVEYGTAWSPNGRRIAFLNFGERVVYTMKADDTDVRVVGTGLGMQFLPGWGPKPRSNKR